MSGIEKSRRADLSSLKILRYPDPRLSEVCVPLEEVDDSVGALAEKMFELMSAAGGVGLAAPQVGVPVRMFIASPTADPNDRRVYVNPEIISVDGSQDGEEGCLSFPGISCRIKRYNVAVLRAKGLNGQVFEETAEGLTARIFQHECDHLDGRLLVDRMGTVARLTHRRALQDLQEQFAGA